MSTMGLLEFNKPRGTQDKPSEYHKIEILLVLLDNASPQQRATYDLKRKEKTRHSTTKYLSYKFLRILACPPDKPRDDGEARSTDMVPAKENLI